MWAWRIRTIVWLWCTKITATTKSWFITRCKTCSKSLKYRENVWENNNGGVSRNNICKTCKWFSNQFHLSFVNSLKLYMINHAGKEMCWTIYIYFTTANYRGATKLLFSLISWKLLKIFLELRKLFRKKSFFRENLSNVLRKCVCASSSSKRPQLL